MLREEPLEGRDKLGNDGKPLSTVRSAGRRKSPGDRSLDGAPSGAIFPCNGRRRFSASIFLSEKLEARYGIFCGLRASPILAWWPQRLEPSMENNSLETCDLGVTQAVPAPAPRVDRRVDRRSFEPRRFGRRDRGARG
jgi:hypothetical protein